MIGPHYGWWEQCTLIRSLHVCLTLEGFAIRRRISCTAFTVDVDCLCGKVNQMADMHVSMNSIIPE